MTTYKCDGFKNVNAEDLGEASRIFAGRLARRKFGKKGYPRVVQLVSWSLKRTSAEYKVFIGKDTPYGCEGHSEFLFVHEA